MEWGGLGRTGRRLRVAGRGGGTGRGRDGGREKERSRLAERVKREGQEGGGEL